MMFTGSFFWTKYRPIITVDLVPYTDFGDFFLPLASQKTAGVIVVHR